MDKFVVVNSRIIDFGKYQEDVKLLQRIIAADLQYYFGKLGFARKAKRSRAALGFYNRDYDLEVLVRMKKKSKPVFV